MMSKQMLNRARQTLRFTQAAVSHNNFVQAPAMGFFKRQTVSMSKNVIAPTQRGFSTLPDHIKLEMPNLSPTMEKGNIKGWNKNVGDRVVPGDVLVDIETDKATIGFEM